MSTLIIKPQDKIIYDSVNSTFDGIIHTGVSDRVTESFISSDGSRWHRKWASGWKEAGGKYYVGSLSAASSIDNIYIELETNFFETTTYTGVASATGTTRGSHVGCARVFDKTVSNFRLGCRNLHTSGAVEGIVIDYYVAGY